MFFASTFSSKMQIDFLKVAWGISPVLHFLLNILRWQSHPISRNRATGSVIESRSSDGGSHDLCRGSQYGDLAFDRSFPLPHGYFPVNPHGIGRWYDAVKDRIGKGTASQSFMPAFRHEL